MKTTRKKDLSLPETLCTETFNTISSPIFLHDQSGKIYKANRAYLKLAGATFEQACGRFYWELFPKSDGPMPGCLDEFASADAGQSAQEADIFVGDRVYRSLTYVVKDPADGALYSLHQMEDVSKKRKIRNALRHSEKQFRDVTDSINDVLILLDRNMKIQLLNAAAITAYQIDPDAYQGQCCHQIFWNSPDRCPDCPTLEAMQTGQTTKAQRHMGDGRILDRTIYPIFDDKGCITACAVVASDVTEREKHIQALQRFKQILSTTTDLVSFVDQNHNYLAANELYSKYYGIPQEDIVGQHVQDIIGSQRYEKRGRKVYNACLQGETQVVQSWIDFPRMGLRHMDITFTPFRNDAGQVTGVVTRAKDTTELTEQDVKLRLSAKVFESTSEGIIVTAPDGEILTVNAAFSNVTGYTEAEVLGQSPRLLKSGRHSADYYRQMWDELIANGQWRGEIWNRRKNGEIYPELLTISAIKNDIGETLNYAAVFTDITTLKESAERLEFQAHHHPLTGLPNRLLLRARLEQSLQNAKRERSKGAVLFIDLDNFKKINDSLGHSAGDQILKTVAERLLENTRETDTVAHLSGDEFVVVLNKIRTIQDGHNIVQQLLNSLQRPFEVEGYELFVTGSIGIAEFSGNNETIETLLKKADAAMYRAKESGKNCSQLYTPEMTEIAIEKVLLEGQLRHALKRNEFILYYQPQIDLASAKIVAVEALVRWQHPDIGLVPPDKFIPLCEETGLILPLGEWILKTACQQMLTWRNQGLNFKRIAVNLSGRQIQQKSLPEVVGRILTEIGLPASSLELEITEGFVMQHPEQSIEVLRQIRDLGVELSIDDFGTGHSSLNYLKRLPVNRLKIDRSFIWDIGVSPEGEAITRAIIAMGHSLDLQITAEGIETAEQMAFLQQLQCNEAQGFFISHPVTAEQFEKLFLARSIEQTT